MKLGAFGHPRALKHDSAKKIKEEAIWFNVHPSEDAQPNMDLLDWICKERQVAEWILGGSASGTCNLNPTNCCHGAIEPCDRCCPGANAHPHRLVIAHNAVGSGNAAMYKQR